MGKSRRQRILENIEATLAGITKGDTYNTTFKANQITRSAIDLGREQNLWPTILIGVTDIPANQETGPVGDLTIRELTVDLTIGLANLTSVLPAHVEEAVTDIMNAMEADTTRGGYADTQEPPEIREPSYSQVLEAHAFITLSYEITYRHVRTNATLPL